MFSKLFLFAGDQKIEHLNTVNPEHMFNIASKVPIDVFATQLGLIDRYGQDYKDVKYVVKLNSKTNIIPRDELDPLSVALHSVEDVLEFRDRKKLKIVGVGYTVYIGSEQEAAMLFEAAQAVYKAHRAGLMAILWMYPRGRAVKDECDSEIIAGAASVGAALGADFVKVNPPSADTSAQSAAFLKRAVEAAGRTGVICSGGAKRSQEVLLHELHDQIHLGGARGCAIGRNIHSRSEGEAIALCKKIREILGG